MTITKEASIDLQEKYQKVTQLLEEESKNDPEHDPYHSKYKAKQILIGMRANLENLLRQNASTANPYETTNTKLLGMLAAVTLHLATIAIDTDEPTTGEKHLDKCAQIIHDHHLAPECILTTLHLYNTYGLLYSQRDFHQSLAHLQHAQDAYRQFQTANHTPVPTPTLFTASTTANPALALQSLEQLFTLTLYYLAQIYGKLDQPVKSAYYCHVTLKRQLEGKGDALDHIEWSLNAATLSQFFVERNAFAQARHHLAASSQLLDVYRQTEILDAAQTERLQHRSADVARCWAKYGLVLLENSKSRLMEEEDDAQAPFDLDKEMAMLSLTDAGTDVGGNFTFALDLTEREKAITDQFLLTFDDAKKVFANVMQWLKDAHAYYTLDAHASDHIEIVQDQSQAYLKLLFFEESADNRAKMHKRRVDLLDAVLAHVNPVYYLPYCRQIWFELGQTYESIREIKMDQLKARRDRATPHAVTKINALIDKSVHHLREFIASFKEAKTVERPYERAYLQAHFLIGALHGRHMSLDKAVLRAHAQKSLAAYKSVIDYCNVNEEVAKDHCPELSICNEMAMLLPLKIAKLSEECV